MRTNRRIVGGTAESKAAGFWLRVWAYLIDLSILTIPSILVGYLIMTPLSTLIMGVLSSDSGSGGVDLSTFVSMFVGAVATSLVWATLQLLIGILYFAFFEGSPLQGTPGKVLFKLRVTDEEEEPLAFEHALSRNVARAAAIVPFILGMTISFVCARLVQLPTLALTLFFVAVVLTMVISLIQYPLAVFTPRKQALHDVIAHTMVMRRAEMPLAETALKAILAVLVYTLVVGQVPTFDKPASRAVSSASATRTPPPTEAAPPTAIPMDPPTTAPTPSESPQAPQVTAKIPDPFSEKAPWVTTEAYKVYSSLSLGATIEAAVELAGFPGELEREERLRVIEWRAPAGSVVARVTVGPDGSVYGTEVDPPGTPTITPKTLARYQEVLGDPGIELPSKLIQHYIWRFPDKSTVYAIFEDGKRVSMSITAN